MHNPNDFNAGHDSQNLVVSELILTDFKFSSSLYFPPRPIFLK